MSSTRSSHKFWLLLDASKNEAQFRPNVRYAGAITRLRLEELTRCDVSVQSLPMWLGDGRPSGKFEVLQSSKAKRRTWNRS